MKDEKPFRLTGFIRWAALGAFIVFAILVALVLLAALTPTPV